MYPNEIDFTKFEVKSQISRGDSQWSVKILYQGATLKIQTAILTSTFNLQGYTYPGQTQKKYSLNVTLDPNMEGISDLKKLIEQIDAHAQNTANEDYGVKDCEYVSPIKVPENPKYLPHLRCKMVSNSYKFKFKAYVDGVEFEPTIEVLEGLIKRGTKMELILQLNPLWKVRGKYGVSYQIVGLNVIDEEVKFRREPLQKLKLKVPIERD